MLLDAVLALKKLSVRVKRAAMYWFTQSGVTFGMLSYPADLPSLGFLCGILGIMERYRYKALPEKVIGAILKSF